MPVPSSVPVEWASGTAYDLFASLFVLHHIEQTGIRKAWAAGVRNRLATEHKDLLELLSEVVGVPVAFLATLGPNRSATDALGALDRLDDREVLHSLSDVDFRPGDPDTAPALLAAYADAESTGARLRSALREYYERFFRDEEPRISPHLQHALEAAKSRSIPLIDLVDELTGGLHLESIAEASRIVLVPSFWAGPLALFEMQKDGTWVILFGARPKEVSLIPGESVPDALIRSLAAVSDQTRLRILRLLFDSPRTQAEVARALRLRPPTITHHLKILRLANLVRLNESTAGEKKYGVRTTRLSELGGDLVGFVTREGESSDPSNPQT